jgi:hypothetical protein
LFVQGDGRIFDEEKKDGEHGIANQHCRIKEMTESLCSTNDAQTGLEFGLKNTCRLQAVLPNLFSCGKFKSKSLGFIVRLDK